MSDETIKTIARAAACDDLGRVVPESYKKNVAALYDANVSACTERYQDLAEDFPPSPEASKTQALMMLPAEPVALLKSIDCYEYQACDWSKYTGSEAQKIAVDARAKTIRRLPGYNEATWG